MQNLNQQSKMIHVEPFKGLHTHILSVGLTLSIACSMFLLVQSAANAQENEQVLSPNPPQLINPNLQRPQIKESDIDTEEFEIGLYAGAISIEDFSSSSLIGATLAYHVNENMFIEANYGQAQSGETSFELLSGGAPFLTEDERDFRYYDLSVGYKFNGETFFTDELVFNSDFYLLLGAGSTEFGGEERFTVSLGGGYRLLVTDFFALRFDVKDHIFNSDIIGEEKDVHNLSMTISTTFFF